MLNTSRKLSCSECQLELGPYFHGELAEDEVSILDEHLADCEACRNALGEIEITLTLIDTALGKQPVLLPDGFLSAKIRQRQRESYASQTGVHRGRQKLLYVLGMAASFLIGVFAAVWGFNHGPQQTSSGFLTSAASSLGNDLSDRLLSQYLNSIPEGLATAKLMKEMEQNGFPVGDVKFLLVPMLVNTAKSQQHTEISIPPLHKKESPEPRQDGAHVRTNGRSV